MVHETFLTRIWKFTKWPRTPGITLKKNMAFFEGNQLFAGDFHALLDEINAVMLQFSKKWNWYGLSNIKGTFGHGASKGCRKTNQR